ncbi:response regulator transcription factor [Actinoplanes couchii]|nr:response regulator transcription factor [Actinoplanes couchii]MDR6318210.1 DNA-binding response OmpR family regulator [Actinoplanes couchii]
MSRILIAEDDVNIASFIQKGLHSAGFVTTHVADGGTALLLARGGGFDLVILDIGLPLIDGFEVLRQLRAEGLRLPVIVLTARDGVEDTVAGLEGGANDYVSKPFRFAELLARIRVRLQEAGPPPAAGDAGMRLEHGDLLLDLRTRRAHVDDRVYDLTAREFGLLEMFLRHPGQVLTREQILAHVWGFDFDPASNVVDVYVRTLRKKVGEARIHTVYGQGYRLP